MRGGIFVTDKVPEEARAILSDYDVFEKQADDAVLSECGVLMTWPARAKPELLKRMKSLRMIQTLSAGVDGLPVAEIPKKVEVYSNAGAFTESVGEHAWGMVLGLAKGIHLRKTRALPRQLRRKTLLVVGAGEIGSEVAKLARSLDMKVIGVSRSFRHPELFDERYPPDSLEKKIPSADAVIIALPLTRGTRGMIGKRALHNAKETVIVVNVGRGETVSELELIDWLKQRPESRYATDVFWNKDGREVFDSAAWDLPNFAGSLHVSGVPVGEPLVEPFVRAAKNVDQFMRTGSAKNRVNLEDYGR